jgi:hypothetical protein
MGYEWRDCIVTLIDMVGVRKRAKCREASSLMRRLHNLVVHEGSDLPAVANAYAWNDSVLLLSYVDGRDAAFEAAIRDADKLKRRIDELEKSYAIAVKGQAFPSARCGHMPAGQASRVTIIEASSWALANCFAIEKVLGRKLRKPWYIDDRIAKRLRTCQTFQTEKVPLLPSNRPRTVYVYNGCLW